MLILRAIVQLTRLDSSLLAFLAIFLPLFVRTNDLALSLRRAIPLLFICVCTFVANDLDDVERDKVNHPQRPLPSGHISPTFAVILYFGSLGGALFSTRHYVSPRVAFWYYALIAIAISYGYIIEFCPSVKAPYVAVASTFPILIVAAWYPDETRLYIVAGSGFLFIIGREICMDIKDRAGDPISFMHAFKPTSLAVVAFSLQFVGLLSLAGQARERGDIVVILLITLLLSASSVYWFRYARFRRAIILMKLPFFVGLYFLF